MDLTYVREFLAFSECMNVSEAARRLHMSQPTLSNHIASVEKEVGAQLVNRNQPLSLTLAGRHFVDRAFELLKHYEDLLQEVREVDTSVLNLSISLNSAEIAPHRTLMTRIYRLRDQRPNLSVDYQECKYFTALEALQDEAVDCVAVYMCPIASDLEAGVVYRRVPALYPNRLMISLDKKNPLSERTSVKWADLAGMSTVVADNYFQLWVTTTRQMLEGHVDDLKVRFSAFDVQGHLQSLGVNDIHLYDESCQDLIVVKMNTRRVNVLLDEPEVSECYIAYLPDRVSPALQLLLDYLDTCEDWQA